MSYFPEPYAHTKKLKVELNLIFVACMILDKKIDWPYWPKEKIVSISPFRVEISKVLEVLG